MATQLIPSTQASISQRSNSTQAFAPKPRSRRMSLFRPLTGLIAAALFASCVTAQPRLPTIAPDQYTPEQAKAAKDFLEARHTPVFGPFEPLMYSPELMSDARAMGDYLRYHASIGPTLSEFAILIVASHWQQTYEWYVHCPLALKAGVPRAAVEAVAKGQRPDGLSADQAAVYDFVTELQNDHRVGNAHFAAIQARFGERGAVDLAGLAGYYTLLAMELNMAHYPTPSDPAVPVPLVH
jgi:4-carboxymuconolactone decarboxylase